VQGEDNEERWASFWREILRSDDSRKDPGRKESWRMNWQREREFWRYIWCVWREQFGVESVHVDGGEGMEGEVRNVWTVVENSFSANLEDSSAMKDGILVARVRIEERSLGR